ncbi:hypothetical protein HG531_006639 [Fusarium graminearum]|nr:hypothetical protein HG531_006639 [Fusarium graminearum]
MILLYSSDPKSDRTASRISRDNLMRLGFRVAVFDEMVFRTISGAYLEALRAIVEVARSSVVKNSRYEEEPNLPLRDKGRALFLAKKSGQQINPKRVVQDGHRQCLSSEIKGSMTGKVVRDHVKDQGAYV